MENFGIVVSAGIRAANSSGQLRKWMEAHFPDNLVAVEVKGEGLGVAEFPRGVLPEVLQRREGLVFSGEPLQLFQAYLIWIPFSVPVESPVSLWNVAMIQCPLSPPSP